MPSKVIVTGAAGFIGFYTCKKLLKENFHVIGIDNINDYYDVKLKYSRLEEINKYVKRENKNWDFIKVSLENNDLINTIFEKFKPDIVINLAAQAGVRYSIENPKSYIDSNLIGFYNILEKCRKYNIKNFIYASSSSVYGGNKKLPYCENDPVDHPVSLYAATKKSNEILAHSYSHLFEIPSTCLRFFTVYGPWGRPDMAPMLFANAIKNKLPIKVFNYGKMKRDFTYIDDVVEAIYRCCLKPATADEQFDALNPSPATSKAPHRIFNLGNNNSVELLTFINILEKEMGLEAEKEFVKMQQGDVEETAANTEYLSQWINFAPNTSLQVGIKNFVKWFIDFY